VLFILLLLVYNNKDVEVLNMDEINERLATLKEIISKKNVPELRKICDEYNRIDIAEVASLLEETELLFIFKTVPTEITAEIFTYLDSEVKEKLVNSLSGEQLGSMLEYVYSDDIVDFIEEMPSNLVKKILKSASKETRTEINQLLNYKPYSAGSLMTTEYIELNSKDTCKQAIEKIRIDGKDAETISYLYIVDDKRKLVGSIYLKAVLLANEIEVISNIMDTDFVSVKTNDDQEEVAAIFKKYDINTIPVTTEDGHLVGIITVDDILDVIEEETTEDIQKMAAVATLDEEYIKTSAFNLARKRIVWLLLLMVSATFTGMIINGYEELLVQLPILSIFVPMLMDTSGNAGSQTSVLVIRALVLNEITTKDYFRVLRKEFYVALMVGLVLAMVVFSWILIQFKIGIIDSSLANTLQAQAKVGLTVALTLYCTVICSKLVGATLPILAKKLHLDPALMASALVTTIVDSISLSIYFLIAMSILSNLL
jgi:magnesium transporter